MLQNKFLFNQSSVSLEIIGLPDYSNNEEKDHISIISQWKLMIIDKPLIEGNFTHLGLIMNAFYTYSTSLLNDELVLYQSNLIDIKPENSHTHKILLKSSKPEVQPLNITIGNAVLADIVNCFDQLGSSNKVRNICSNELSNIKKKKYSILFDKNKISKILFPPLASLVSIFIVSTALVYVYSENDNYDNRTSLILK